MEALEEEMSVEVEEDFQPQSQIFTKPAAEAAVAAQTPRAQPLGMPPLSAQAQTAPARMAAQAPSPQMATVPPRHAQSQPRVDVRSNIQAATSPVVSHPAMSQAAAQKVAQEAMQAAHDYQPEMAQAPQTRRGNTGQAVAGQATAGASASRIPDIEDFPPLLRQNIRPKADGEMESGQGPRKLWHKLTQSLIQRDGEVPAARLEPAASPEMRQEEEASHAISQPAAASAPRRAQATAPTAYSEEEQLEIPAFLRRQVN